MFVLPYTLLLKKSEDVMFFKKKIPQSVDFIVVGLGNPGKKYENTRHNAGFIALDVMAEKLGVSINRIKYKGLCHIAKIGDKKVLLLKPSTFMNLSGQSVVEAMNFYKIPPERCIIIYDDISLDVGKMRIRRSGSHGGQNGMKNIIYLSGRDNFPRIKIGIGKKPHPDYDLADWVLSGFTKDDTPKMKEVFDNAFEAVKLMVEENTDKAMNMYNS